MKVYYCSRCPREENPRVDGVWLSEPCEHVTGCVDGWDAVKILNEFEKRVSANEIEIGRLMGALDLL